MASDGVEKSDTKRRFAFKKLIAVLIVIAAISFVIAIIRLSKPSSLKDHVFREVPVGLPLNTVWLRDNEVAIRFDSVEIKILNVETGVTNSFQLQSDEKMKGKSLDQNSRLFVKALGRVWDEDNSPWVMLPCEFGRPRKLEFSFDADESMILAYSENKAADYACWITERNCYLPLKFDFTNRQLVQWKSLILRVSRYTGANVHYYDITPLFYDSPQKVISPITGLHLSPSGKYLLLNGEYKNSIVFKMKHLMQ